MATLIRQLTKMTQKVMNPALAPKTVVAISSPEPTIDAERINPGPRNLSWENIERGGVRVVTSGVAIREISQNAESSKFPADFG